MERGCVNDRVPVARQKLRRKLIGHDQDDVRRFGGHAHRPVNCACGMHQGQTGRLH